jgi:hypothetical protein
MSSPLNIVLRAIVEQFLRPYQREWVHGILRSDRAILLGARQIGKTTTIAVAALLLVFGVNGASAHDVYIVSRSQKASEDFLNRLKDVITAIEKVVKITGRQYSKTCVQLLNGRKIYAVSSKPEAIQGFTGHVLVDEVTANPNDHERLYTQALSVASSNNEFKVILISNAGRSGCWLDLMLNEPSWEERREDTYISSCSIYEAYPTGIPDKIAKLQRTMHPIEWAIFYECEFKDSETNPWSIEDFTILQEQEHEGPAYIAVDPGFVSNPTGICVVRRTQTGFCVLEAYHLHKPTTGEIEANIERLVDKWKPRSIWCDQGAVGRDTALNLKSKYGSVPVSVNTVSRNTGLESLDRHIREKRISFVAGGCTDLLMDMQRVERDLSNGVWDLPEYTVRGLKAKIHCDALDALLTILVKAPPYRKTKVRGLTAPNGNSNLNRSSYHGSRSNR